MIMLIVLAILFGIMAIVFLMGKGSSLIAGYNMASQKEKAQYDEKKLCRVMGIGTMMMSISMFLMAFLKEKAMTFSIILMLGAVVFIVVGANTICVRKDVQKNSKNKIGNLLSVLFPLIIVGVVTVMLFTGNIEVQLHEKSLTAGADGWAAKTIEVEYEDIESIDYVSNMSIGKRTFGVGSPTLQAGRFRNDKLGNYRLYSYTKCKEYIVLNTNEGYVVLNQKNKEKTKQLYNQLEKKLNNGQ